MFIALAEIRKLAQETGHTMAHLALAWLLHQPGVTSALVGARQPEEVAWNLPAVDLELSDDVLDRLCEITEPVKAKLDGNPDMWFSTSRMR